MDSVETEEEYTERLRLSMESSPVRTNPEAAREFLSKLPMYDENGRLIVSEEGCETNSQNQN